MYKLLIVDDEPLIRRGIKSLANLSDMGITEIIEAETGVEAVEMATHHHPHIILMDINMPDMDGLTASAKIKEQHPEIIVIILTGYDYFEYARNAIRAKVDDYILKPISKSDIELVFSRTVALINERKKQTEIQGLTEDIVKTDSGDISIVIREYLEVNLFNNTLSLANMSDELGFNSSYLSVVFKQIYGIPFQEYITRKRMEKAKLLLLTSSMKNYEIAEAVGIDDVNYFITKFKKTWGITPKQYRQTLT